MPATRSQPVRLLVLGQLVPPLMSVPAAAALLGYRSRTHAYEIARREAWPMDGGRVLSVPFCERFGLAYEVAAQEVES